MLHSGNTATGKGILILVFVIVFVLFAGDLFARHGGRHGGYHGRHHGMHSEGHAGPGICPQQRATAQAPKDYLDRTNPLEPSEENLYAGESLFQVDAQPTACKICHGAAGNGFGMMAAGLNPPPRNFTCVETMQAIPDGQLFWIIQKGAPGTGMPPYRNLTDEQIWKLILYIKSLSK